MKKILALVAVAFAAHAFALAPAAKEDAYRQNNIGVAKLEQYDYAGAIASFRRALEIDDSLAMARLNLAIALLHDGQLEPADGAAAQAAAQLSSSPQPSYVMGLVARADHRTADAIAAFRRVLAMSPSDVGSRVQLAQLLLAEREYNEAASLFQQALDLEPVNATAAYGLATAFVRQDRAEQGERAMRRFETLRSDPAAITYSTNYLEDGRYGEAVASTGLEPDLVNTATPDVTFVDATAEMLGEASASGITLFDADDDGDLDLLLLEDGRMRLVRNTNAHFDVSDARTTTLPASTPPNAVAGDYDNDGRPDLFLIGQSGGRLLHQDGGSAFTDVTGAVRMPAVLASETAAFVDVDHDGDLDIVTGAPQLLRNNGNGSFSDITSAAGFLGSDSTKAPAIGIVPTDFDNHREIDVLFVPADGAPRLFSNLRDGTFRDVAVETRFAGRAQYRAVAAGDINKDGATDFVLARAGTAGRIVMSDGEGHFTVADAPAETAGATAAQLVDYDDDGVLDLLVLTPRGPRVWRYAVDRWLDVTTRAFPAALQSSRDPAIAMATGDLDGDGDTDMVVRLMSGGVRVWRNDGGSRNASLRVRLEPRVSNRTAAGARIDMRAGSLRQKIEVSAVAPPVAPADVVFGLGTRGAADVVRVLWPAGILQAETASSDRSQTIAEIDRKPSSCPFLFAWNGSRFAFVTDFLGGGEIGAWEPPGVRTAPDPDEYVRVRDDQLQPRDGRYELRVTNELEEVLFLDRVQLVAVAHPSAVDVYPNEGLRSPSERRPFVLTTVERPRAPRRVDGLAFALRSIQGYAEDHALTIDLGLRPGESRARLLLTGWTDYAFSSDNVAADQAGLAPHPPSLQVQDRLGQWRDAIAEIGLPVGHPQTIVVDLSPWTMRGTSVVRVVTNLRVHWTEILVDTSSPAPYSIVRLEPSVATLRERGFTTHDNYASVSAVAPWKRMPGRYTREGDVRPLLTAVDDRFVIAAPGDEIAVSFDASALPPLSNGWRRTFLLFADGFSKEMNLRSASPDRVEPLPYHAMSRYPYAGAERDPETSANASDRATYNTRVIGRMLPPLDAHAAPAGERSR